MPQHSPNVNSNSGSDSDLVPNLNLYDNSSTNVNSQAESQSKLNLSEEKDANTDIEAEIKKLEIILKEPDSITDDEFTTIYKKMIWEIPESLYPAIKRRLEWIDDKVLLEFQQFIESESTKPFNELANEENVEIVNFLQKTEPDPDMRHPDLLKKILDYFQPSDDVFGFLYGLQNKYPYLLYDINDLGLVLRKIPPTEDNIDKLLRIFSHNSRKYTIYEVDELSKFVSDELLKFVPGKDEPLFFKLIKPLADLTEYSVRRNNLALLKKQNIKNIKTEYYDIAIANNAKLILDWLIFSRLTVILMRANFQSTNDLQDLLIGIADLTDGKISTPLPEKFCNTVKELNAEKAILPNEYSKSFNFLLRNIILGLLTNMDKLLRFYHAKKLLPVENQSNSINQESKSVQKEINLSDQNIKKLNEEVKKIRKLLTEAMLGLEKIKVNPKKDINKNDEKLLQQQITAIKNLINCFLPNKEFSLTEKVELFEKYLIDVKASADFQRKVKSDVNTTFFSRPAPPGKVFLEKIEPILKRVDSIMKNRFMSTSELDPRHQLSRARDFF